MPLYLTRKIDLLFFIVVVIFSGLFYTILQSTNYTRTGSGLVSQTQDFLYNLEKVESSITAIETAHRGFVITGNEAYLENIPQADLELAESRNRLESLSENNTEQKNKLRLLNSLVERKLQNSKEAIALLKNESQVAALRFISTEKGKVLMDSIRMISRDLERDKITNLDIVTNLNEDYIVNQNTYFLLFAAFILIIMFLFYLRVRNNSNEIVGLHSKQQELIDELNYQNKQLDDFAHLTSHNIRSPAVNIYSLISLLNEKSTIEDYKLIFEKLTKVSRNLNETLNELMEVLHVRQNKTIEKHEVKFEDLFNKVVESLQGDILNHGADITSEFEVTSIEYPKTYMESIFHNLLSNSIKYRSTKRPLNIHVATKEIEGKVYLTVKDNGLGIDLNRHGNSVFGLRKTFHRNQDSKGIGLFMTKTQIEALGGNISVESEVDNGSVFTIAF